MKQLSALGARRHFFRNPRRMRALRAGMSPNDLDDGDMMAGPGFGYFSGNPSIANTTLNNSSFTNITFQVY